MWLDTNLAFRRLDTTMADQWPPFPLFLNFWGFAFANFDCRMRKYLHCNVNNMCIIVYYHYKNTSIRYCEEYKKIPDPKNSTVSWLRTQFWMFLDLSLYDVLFYLDIIINFTLLRILIPIAFVWHILGLRKKQKTRAYCVILLIWRSSKPDFFLFH